MLQNLFMPFFAFLLFFSASAVFSQQTDTNMSRSMEQAIRLYRVGENTEAMDRFMDILVKGSPSEKALANEYISKITMGMNTGVTGVNDAEADAGLAIVRDSKKSMSTSRPSSETFSPEEISEENTEARRAVIEKRIKKTTEEMQRDVLLKITNLNSVKIYTKNGKLTALSMNSNYFFAGDTTFKGGTEEALSLISGLIFTLGKVNCLILPEGSVGGDIKIKNIRRAIALNSYFDGRGISKAKIDVDLTGSDVSIPKELSNVGGMIILFDYTKEPRLKPLDDLKEKGPRISLGAYPTSIAPHKNEGAIVEFSVMETPAGIPSWSFQIYQAQPDGSRLQLQEIHGTGAQFNQTFWNGRRNFFGVPYPAGRYIFSLTAKDIEGNETTVSRYVQIQPSKEEERMLKERGVVESQTLKRPEKKEENPFKSINISEVKKAPSAKAKKSVSAKKKAAAAKAKKNSNKKKKVTNSSAKQSDSANIEYKVFFREDTSNITPAGTSKISLAADSLSVYANANASLVGYASSSEPEPNSLAESRVNFVADQLVEKYGIDASRITTSSEVTDTPQSTVVINISKGE